MSHPISLHTRAITPKAFALFFILIVAAILANACAPAATPAPFVVRETVVVNSQPQQPTLAPRPMGAPPTGVALAVATPAKSADSPSSLPTGQSIAAVPFDRKIIKNSQLVAIVADVDVAVARMTDIASNVGGYLFSSRTYFEGTRKIAQVTISVPVDRFEDALNLVRHIALKIESDTAGSSDVSEQYVDLESRLRNLESTAARIREFLGKAQTVDEALKINAQLSAVDAQIEEIKGKLNALKARSAFSTITADLRELVPTPTPTHTPTITPTPTPTMTPTPVGWQPDQTFNDAITVQGSILRALGNLTIWFIVLLLPYLVVLGLLVYGLAWLARKARPTRTPTS